MTVDIPIGVDRPTAPAPATAAAPQHVDTLAAQPASAATHTPTSSVPASLSTRSMGNDHRPCGARQCRPCAARADWHHGAWYAMRRAVTALLQTGAIDEATAELMTREASWHRTRSLAYENACAVGVARLPEP